MECKDLSNIIKENGVVGAGGAGCPTDLTIADRAQIIEINSAD